MSNLLFESVGDYNYVFVFICHSAAVIVPIVTCLTSFVGGFIVFSVAGFLSIKSGVHVSEAISTGALKDFCIWRHIPIVSTRGTFQSKAFSFRRALFQIRSTLIFYRIKQSAY